MSSTLITSNPELLLQENSLLKQQVISLQNQLDWFKQQLFGQKTERRLVDVPPEQGSLFESLSAETSAPDPVETIQYERKKSQKQRHDSVNDSGLRFDENVTVEEIRIESPELSGPQADQYRLIDEHITYRLAQRPSSYVVLKYIQPVIKHIGSSQITTKSAPTPVFEKSLADVSFLVGLVIDKFLYHQPLYRQHQKLQANGIILSRSTLTNYIHRTGLLLKPVYDALLRSILQSKILAMDETPIKAGRKKKGKMQQAWFWPLLGDQNEMAFHFDVSRARSVVDGLLQNFDGTLVTDGYAVYTAYASDNKDTTLAQCWMHARRYFIKAEKEEPESVNTALSYIRALYKHDEIVKNKALLDDACQAYRSQHCKPVAEAFFEWCQQQTHRTDLLPTSLLGKAIRYARNHEASLQVFLSDPRVPMDTGAVERGLRVIPMGKKNWLFNWTEVGAVHMGVIQSLIVTCKMQGINPNQYLTDVLQRVSMHPASRVDELTPRNWKVKYGANFLTSDLDRAGQ